MSAVQVQFSDWEERWQSTFKEIALCLETEAILFCRAWVKAWWRMWR